MNKIEEYHFRKHYRNEIPNTRYLTHGIHSYTAKFIPHIPRYFIQKYTLKGDIIFDPFCGSGTALVESKLLGRNSIGVDINPLARLLTEVKTTPISHTLLHRAIEMIKEKITNSDGSIEVQFPRKDYWFCKSAQKDLQKIRFLLEDMKHEFNESIDKFFRICLSSIIRRSSNADTRMAKTYISRRMRDKISSGWLPEPISYFENTLENYPRRIVEFTNRVGLDDGTFTNVYAKDFKDFLLPNDVKEVDFIITSPPYINAQDYFRSYKLEILWLGLANYEAIQELNRKAIGTERLCSVKYSTPPRIGIKQLDVVLHKIHKKNNKKAHIIFRFFKDMSNVIKKCYNLLKHNGYLCLVIGDNTICGSYIPTHQILIAIAEKSGFKLQELGKDRIVNRALSPQRNHNAGVIKDEWIMTLQKN